MTGITKTVCKSCGYAFGHPSSCAYFGEEFSERVPFPSTAEAVPSPPEGGPMMKSDLSEALALIGEAREVLQTIALNRRKLGPIATHAQVAGNKLAKALSLVHPAQDGWVLVPREPTPKMMMAYAKSIGRGYSSTVVTAAWRNMLAAASDPTPEPVLATGVDTRSIG